VHLGRRQRSWRVRRAVHRDRMAKLVLCLVAVLVCLSSADALRASVMHTRPVPVILAELHSEFSEESGSGSMSAASEMSAVSESSSNTISATDLAASSSSLSTMMGSSSMNTQMPVPVPGPDPMAHHSHHSSSHHHHDDAGSSSSSSQDSSSSSHMGSDFSSNPAGRRPSRHNKHHHKKERLPETDVFGEAPHTDLTNDEVDMVARMIMKNARKARCAQEDEYCQIQFKNCRDEQCRRQVEDQASLNPWERKQIRKLLKNS